MKRSLFFLLAAALLAGCQEKPRAPALVPTAVFRSDALGLTFVAPDGWALYARAEPPPGRYDRPMRMVAYRSTEGEQPANLELYALDLRDGQGVMEYLAASPIGPEKWTDTGPPTKEMVNGAEAVRYTQTTSGGKSARRRELVEFRRPGRTYLFVATYLASDAKSREQIRRAVETTKWD